MAVECAVAVLCVVKELVIDRLIAKMFKVFEELRSKEAFIEVIIEPFDKCIAVAVYA